MPPRAVSVPLRFQREGIRYDDLSDDEKDQWDALDWNDDGERPDEVDPEAVNKWLFNTDTVDKVLETLMTRGEKVAGGDRLSKTIIFAKNQHHAAFIAERFYANYPERLGSFAGVITYQSEYAQNLIDDFSAKDKVPAVHRHFRVLADGFAPTGGRRAAVPGERIVLPGPSTEEAACFVWER